jgi:hypothetical protein
MVFLNRVKVRATAFSWASILRVPHTDTLGLPPVPTNVINSYGIVTIKECKTFATAYLARQDRDSQLCAMFNTFLRNSLSNQANKIVDLHASEYTINGLTDGLCLLKYIITKSYVDTNSNVTVIRRAIGRLDEKIQELKYDIKSFNQ